MTRPIRIQRKRTKGFDMQAESRAINGLECVYVGRPTIYGNPYQTNIQPKTNEENQVLVDSYRLWLSMAKSRNPDTYARINLEQLRGKNLSCFCRLDQPCHADVLLELANR